MPSVLAHYSLHTKHDIDKRVWEIASTSRDNLIAWSSERVLDKVNGEVVEWVRSRDRQHIHSACSIHTPTKGWYLLIKSPSPAFKADQDAASSSSSFSSSSTSSPFSANTDSISAKRATYSDDPDTTSSSKGKGRGRGYVNLVPSRTNPSTDFKFRFAHAVAPSGPVDGNTNDRGSSSSTSKRRSFVVVDTEGGQEGHGQGLGHVARHVPTNTDTDTDTDMGHNAALGPLASSIKKEEGRSHRLSTADGDLSSGRRRSHSASRPASASASTALRQSSFLLRPIAHGAAKVLASGGGTDLVGAGQSQGSAGGNASASHAPTARRDKRLSLRGIANLFTPKDNSFELLWEDDNTGAYIPILIYEDHPSLIRTETSGTLHIEESLILRTFQCRERSDGGSSSTFDPVTFFVTVGIAYLGFLEDQEAYKAASHG